MRTFRFEVCRQGDALARTVHVCADDERAAEGKLRLMYPRHRIGKAQAAVIPAFLLKRPLETAERA